MVIKFRLVRIAWGGRETCSLVQSMVAEKIEAALEASVPLMSGGTPERVIVHYREHVAANTRCLPSA